MNDHAATWRRQWHRCCAIECSHSRSNPPPAGEIIPEAIVVDVGRTMLQRVMDTNAIRSLSDERLLRDVETAAGDERGATAHLIALLTEMDARRLYLPQGYSSMFVYCTR